jgi:hypothetical protein
MQKKTKWIIGLSVLAVIVLFTWWSSKKETEPLTATDPYKDKVTKRMEEIRSDTDWFKSISEGSVKAGLTVNQGLANNAIWALKHDGIIPVTAYGAGEWGHVDYAKAAF